MKSFEYIKTRKMLLRTSFKIVYSLSNGIYKIGAKLGSELTHVRYIFPMIRVYTYTCNHVSEYGNQVDWKSNKLTSTDKLLTCKLKHKTNTRKIFNVIIYPGYLK